MPTHEERRHEVQSQLDALNRGGVLQLQPNEEVRGPLYVRNGGITIDGRRATFWSPESPVLSIEADGVTLRYLRLENTDNREPAGCALSVKPGLRVVLEKVEVQGSISGLEGEEGEWRYPKEIHLGQMPYIRDVEHTFLIKVFVPVNCQVSSQVDGLKITPGVLSQGLNELQIAVDVISRDTLFCGHLFLTTTLVKRRIPVHGQVSSGEEKQPVPIDKKLLWEPPDIPTMAYSAPAPLSQPSVSPPPSPVQPQSPVPPSPQPSPPAQSTPSAPPPPSVQKRPPSPPPAPLPPVPPARLRSGGGVGAMFKDTKKPENKRTLSGSEETPLNSMVSPFFQNAVVSKEIQKPLAHEPEKKESVPGQEKTNAARRSRQKPWDAKPVAAPVSPLFSDQINPPPVDEKPLTEDPTPQTNQKKKNKMVSSLFEVDLEDNGKKEKK